MDVSAYAFLVHQRVLPESFRSFCPWFKLLHGYRLQGDVAAACGAECFTGITGEKSRAIEILPKGGDSLRLSGKALFWVDDFSKLP